MVQNRNKDILALLLKMNMKYHAVRGGWTHVSMVYMCDPLSKHPTSLQILAGVTIQRAGIK